MDVAASMPPEIVEEILLNLTVQSLLRFSSVSKSWNSMIFDPRFIRRHRSRGGAALPSRGRIITCPSSHGSLSPASTRSISSMSTDNAPPLISPFKIKGVASGVHFLASCGDLWCVEYAGSLFLWNPSTSTYKKLPNPSANIPMPALHVNFYSFGLGYDSFGDDYKILKIFRWPYCDDKETELYSLRSNSWRKIQRFHEERAPCGTGVAVSGALHWLFSPFTEDAIISFNLSTEKYAEVALPRFHLVSIYDRAALTVLRGKLCLYLNSWEISRFDLWVMQEYGVAKSWTQMFAIGYHSVGMCTQSRFTPLYFYDDGKLLIKSADGEDQIMFIYIDKKTSPQIVFRGLNHACGSGHLYLESLVSPATYCGCPHAT